jgi:hypothetical protein
LADLAQNALEGLVGAFQTLGTACQRGEGNLINFPGAASVQVVACRYRRYRTGVEGWQIGLKRALDCSGLVALRMDANNESVLDMLVLSTASLTKFPRFVSVADHALVAPYSHADCESAVRALGVVAMQGARGPQATACWHATAL